MKSPLISSYLGENIKLKLENMQPFGSYKIRGVNHLLNSLTKEELQQGVVAASAGNMGQAVAFMAQKLNIPCTIIVPDTAPEIKKKRIRELGAVIIEKPFSEVWEYVSQGSCSDIPGYFIHPVNELLLKGYSQIADEIVVEFPEVEAVIIPFGIGGLTLGVGERLKAIRPSIKVITVEPETAYPLKRLLQTGETDFSKPTPSFVDAIGTPEVLPSIRDRLKLLVDGTFSVPLNFIEDALKQLFFQHKIVVEGAGAAALGCVLSKQIGQKNVVCLVSGGNIDLNVLRYLTETVHVNLE